MSLAEQSLTPDKQDEMPAHLGRHRNEKKSDIGHYLQVRGAIERRVESINNSETAELKRGIFSQKILHLLTSNLMKKNSQFLVLGFHMIKYCN